MTSSDLLAAGWSSWRRVRPRTNRGCPTFTSWKLLRTTSYCPESAVCCHRASWETFHKCLYPGLSSVIIHFEGRGCITATVFYSLMGGDVSEGNDGRMLQIHTDLRGLLCCSLCPSIWGSLLLFMLISTCEMQKKPPESRQLRKP